MNKLVLVALLAAAGCGSKRGSDCEPAITRGIDHAVKVLEDSVRDPQIVEGTVGVMAQVRSVLIARCKADGWPPEVVSCFTAVSGLDQMRSCRDKLPREQAASLDVDLSKIPMRAGMRAEGMPAGMPGHPEKLMVNPDPGTPSNAAPGATAGSAPR